MKRLPTAPSSAGMLGKAIMSPLSMGLLPLPLKMKSSARYIGPPCPLNNVPIPLALDVTYLITLAVNSQQLLRFPCPTQGGTLIQFVGPPYGLAGKFGIWVRFGYPPTQTVCNYDGFATDTGIAVAFPQVSMEDIYIWVRGFAVTSAYLSVCPIIH